MRDISMDIEKLKHFISISNEDFADAHEPVNDGVKTPPNAADIAAMIKPPQGKEADITTSGEAKIIPAVDDDTEMDAEKKPAFDTPAEETPEQKQPEEVAEVEDEPSLAHDTVKEVKTDTAVVTKEKEALEAFVPLIRRAEIIGYTKRDKEALSNSIRRIRLKAGVKGTFTVSSESINEAIALSNEHLTRLKRKYDYLTARQKQVTVEEFDGMPSGSPIVEEIVTEQPLAHPGAVPLDPATAQELTLAELQPVIDTVIEDQVMTETLNDIDQHERSLVAIEQFVGLLRENKGRVSKQTAAIIHNTLTHIDVTCNLRARSTGLEGFDTTPKAALESTEVDEKSLMKRAGEIGAKIIAFLKKLYAKAREWWDKLNMALKKANVVAEEVKDKISTVKGDGDENLKLSPVPTKLFRKGHFVGFAVDQSEIDVLNAMHREVKRHLEKVIRPMIDILVYKAPPDSILDKLNAFKESLGDYKNTASIALAGGYIYKQEGWKITITDDDDSGAPEGDTFEVELPGKNYMSRFIEGVIKHGKTLGNSATPDIFKEIDEVVTKGVVQLRRNAVGNLEGDEDKYQAIQKIVTDELAGAFNFNTYNSVVKVLTVIHSQRVAVYRHIIAEFGAVSK